MHNAPLASLVLGRVEMSMLYVQKAARLAAGRGECGVVHVGDAAVMELAARQHGVVTFAQLAALGLGRGAIAHRLRVGRLRALHRGVYLVGPSHYPRTREAAALLAVGERAVLSHHTAAALWSLPISPSPDGLLHVIVAGRDPGSRTGVRVHRVKRLEHDERTMLDGLGVTTPARTLRDIAATAPIRHVERALEHVQIHRLASRRQIDAVLERHPSRRLRDAVQALAEPRLTRSEAERRLLGLIRAARLPTPEANVRVAGHEVDLLWRPNKLVVEVDGYAFHGGRAAFERDRRRDAELLAAGHRVLRVTWRQIANEPEALVAGLAAALVS